MNPHQEDHERILTLIADERWLDFSSEDELLLKACIYAGFVYAAPVTGANSKTRLRLTERGAGYLSELQTTQQAVDVEPTVKTPMHRRRAHDDDE